MERIERMSDLRRSPESDGIEVQFEAIVPKAHASKTKSADASNDKSRIAAISLTLFSHPSNCLIQ
jgi:hypothetical protein